MPPIAESVKRFSVHIAPLALAAIFADAWSAQALTRLDTHDSQAKALIARMSLDEKIGQMIQVEQTSLIEDSDIEKYFLGSLLAGGNGDPKSNSMQDWTDMYDRCQKRAVSTRLKIPLLFGVDALHGHNNVVGAVVFPHNIGLGATRNPALVEQIARVTAEEVRATGIQWTFAPCLAVVRDVRWGRTYESYSEDMPLVMEMGAAAVRGLQGNDLADPRRVLATAKHLAGDGATTYGTGRVDPQTAVRAPLDQGDTRVDEKEMKREILPPYRAAIEAGAASVMASFSSWNGVRASADRHLLTDILKGEMGFQGFVISDYDSLDGIPGSERTRIRKSINAGMDMVMLSKRYREFAAQLKDLVLDGEVPESRIDDAVLRILRVKIAMGLLDEKRSPLADRGLQRTFGASDHRELARRAVRESLVLLKNEKDALPLSRRARRIHVAGRSADDLGRQCGGWTIDWQGQSRFPTTGTTLLQALRNTAPRGLDVTFSEDGSGSDGADAVVVVVGEEPYAEFYGDRETLSLGPEDIAAVTNAKKAGVPVVVVVVSGRPIPLGAAADADAVVAAWLPGSEGQGIADVLFGDYKPSGKLSFAWPTAKAPVYPFGFGLTY